jgi:hypothetical protein
LYGLIDLVAFEIYNARHMNLCRFSDFFLN